MSDSRVRQVEHSKFKRAIAAHGAGCLVGATLGTLVGVIAIKDGSVQGIAIAAVVGAVVGLVVLGFLAWIDSILALAALLSVVPTLLLLKDVARRGRLGEALDDPKFLPILCGIMVGGAVLAAILVGLKRLILRTLG